MVIIMIVRWMAWDRLARTKTVDGLGFKRLRKFNLALLKKQGWHLITNPTSLVAIVLKARYFPSTSFLNSALDSNPSYMWRSIWETKSLL